MDVLPEAHRKNIRCRQPAFASYTVVMIPNGGSREQQRRRREVTDETAGGGVVSIFEIGGAWSRLSVPHSAARGITHESLQHGTLALLGPRIHLLVDWIHQRILLRLGVATKFGGTLADRSSLDVELTAKRVDTTLHIGLVHDDHLLNTTVISLSADFLRHQPHQVFTTTIRRRRYLWRHILRESFTTTLWRCSAA